MTLSNIVRIRGNDRAWLCSAIGVAPLKAGTAFDIRAAARNRALAFARVTGPTVGLSLIADLPSPRVATLSTVV